MSMMKLTQLGTWAFSVKPTGDVGAPFSLKVLSASTPHPRGAPWTVNLNAWQADGNTPASVGVPARNKTAFNTTLRARITFGGGGEAAGGASSEVVEVDYPAAGTVVTVFAASVIVEVFGAIPGAAGPTSGNIPTISGFLTVGRSSARPMTATLTEPVRVVADSAGFQENVPPRARAFRLQVISFVHVLGLLQLSGNGTPVTTCNDTATYIPEIGHTLETSRAQWYPLSPETQAVVVSNQDGLGAVLQYRMQWLLELG